MAQVQVITLACDVCQKEDETVETHALAVDGKAVEVETCAAHWTKVEKALGPVLASGRKVRRKRA